MTSLPFYNLKKNHCLEILTCSIRRCTTADRCPSLPKPFLPLSLSLQSELPFPLSNLPLQSEYPPLQVLPTLEQKLQKINQANLAMGGGSESQTKVI
ncbi:hypothetical protein GIB67_028041 [Kingdonia uniflora]|uniref:Uncharacterized protein n=1 Tax=Kingdonia uniflora TaxID=39325 RepID=A0A7J7NES8_9MAGN|nr:hypothetical protein GIB67_028041 [Kingdonia uniflora]